jgi:hypothetical protein
LPGLSPAMNQNHEHVPGTGRSTANPRYLCDISSVRETGNSCPPITNRADEKRNSYVTP